MMPPAWDGLPGPRCAIPGLRFVDPRESPRESSELAVSLVQQYEYRSRSEPERSTPVLERYTLRATAMALGLKRSVVGRIRVAARTAA